MRVTITFSLFFLIASLVHSQPHITNTLGAGGIFYIKDANNEYITVSQATGEVNILNGLRLQETFNSSISGVIFKGANRFIHDYKPSGNSGFNTFVGINSGNFSMSGTNNWEASRNTSLGYATLTSNTNGFENVAVGFNALTNNTTGGRNTAVGSSTLISNTTGFHNTAIGFGVLYENLTGIQNTGCGTYSLGSNTTGSSNTAFGFNTLLLNTTGSQNTAVGHHSLENNTGDFNTAIGYNAGSTVTTGLNLTLIGIDANPSSPTAIDQITLGNIFVTSLRCNVQNISSLSDARDKKNIKELNMGIDFLMKIQPRLFNWDKREWYDDNKSDGSKMKKEPTAGFIAQELDEVQTTENAEWLNLVLKDNPEKLEATPGNLLPIIVKAIQDLKKENDELKSANFELANQLRKVEHIQSIIASQLEELKANKTNITKVSLVAQ